MKKYDVLNEIEVEKISIEELISGGEKCKAISGNKDIKILTKRGESTVLIIPAGFNVVGDGTLLKKCKYCGQYFIASRPNMEYCSRTISEGRTCYSYGPYCVFRENLRNDEGRGCYTRTYKKMQGRCRRGNCTVDEYNSWKRDAKEMLEKYKVEEISTETFVDWLNSTSKNKKEVIHA